MSKAELLVEEAWAKALVVALGRFAETPIYESVVADLEHRPVLTVARSA